jgi:cytochrome P450
MWLYPPASIVGQGARIATRIGGQAVKRGALLFASIDGLHRDPAHCAEPEPMLPLRPDRRVPMDVRPRADWARKRHGRARRTA